MLGELGYFALNGLQALYLCGWSILWISVALIVSIVSKHLPLALARIAWGPGLIWGAQADVVVEQRTPLSPDENYVFVMNHQSMLDIPVAFAKIPVNLRFFAKRILAFVPFLGWYMWRTGMVFVDRAHRERASRSVEEAAEKVRRGASMLTYPEGTRSENGEILPFKRGAFRIALAAGVPVVPVVIEGSGRALPRGGFRLRPHRVHLVIGEPIETRGYRNDQLSELVGAVRRQMGQIHQSIGGKGLSEP